MQHFDIIIIGAGNAGLTLAAALPTSLNIAVVDHKEKPDRLQKERGGAEADAFICEAMKVPQRQDPDHKSKIDGRKIALNYASKLIFDEFNVWPALAPHVTPITQVHVSQQGHFGITRLNTSENNIPALGYVMAAETLMHCLQAQANTHDNISWFYSAKLLSLETNSINLEHGNLEKTLTAQLVIAADGVQSHCRKLLNIETDITDYEQSALITRIKLKNPHSNIAYERFLKNGTLALLPMQDHYYGVVWMAPTADIENLKKLPDSQLLAQIQKNFGYRLGKFITIDASITYPIRSIIAREQIKDHYLLLGDAAHHTSPIAAQGFNLTLQDIYCLVNLLKPSPYPLPQVVEGNYEEVLGKYLAERIPEQQKIIRSVDNLMETFKSSHFPLPQLRSGALTLLDLTTKKKKNISELFMGMTPQIQKSLRKKYAATI